MIKITLPNGELKTFPNPVSGLEIAKSIGERLAQDMLAVKINGIVFDFDAIVDKDSEVEIITSQSEEGLEVLRHSCAHLLAQAVKQLYPQAQVTIGPVIENGFYYDFHIDKPFSVDDLAKIEEHMYAIAKQDLTVSRKNVGKAEAIKFFADIQENYKVEIINELEDVPLSLYSQGDFTDLCRGPHVPSLRHLKAFKLTSVAGAYWRGDSKNVMLQRIYGTAWSDKKSLRKYLAMLEEAKKRDHRVLAKKMDLFHIQPESPGMVFWHENGYKIYKTLQDYIWSKYQDYDYKVIATPQLVESTLWKKSGHWDKFSNDMFYIESEDKVYALKPMNCPCHVEVFNNSIRSYRDLPLRLAEMGSCHRNEPSGTLHGLMRVRNFVQDDGHIFCTKEQIGSEVSKFIEELKTVYSDFGFHEFSMCLSTRPETRVGNDNVWDEAEKALTNVLNSTSMPWTLSPGEGAFYGPKVEFVLKDCLNRSWQCGTIQLDFSMPSRLGATYIDSSGNKQTPVMLHRAMLGSLERFIAILLEQHSGNLPLWLAPVQIVIAPLSGKQNEYAQNLYKQLRQNGFRVKLDDRNEKIGMKIREHSIQRVPIIGICGEKEAEEDKVAVRLQSGKSLGLFSYEQLVQYIKGN